MSDQLNRVEEMVGTLIKMAGENNSRLTTIELELKDTKDTLHIFRSETNVNLKKLDRKVKMIESDLDTTMVKVEELTPPY